VLRTDGESICETDRVNLVGQLGTRRHRAEAVLAKVNVVGASWAERRGRDMAPNDDEKVPSPEDPRAASHDDDSDLAAILSRRRKFIAAAIAGIAMSASADCNPVPQPCLSPAPAGSSGPDGPGGTIVDVPTNDAGVDGAVDASTTMKPMPPRDAGDDAWDGSSRGDETSDPTPLTDPIPPRPCLSRVPPRPPKPPPPQPSSTISPKTCLSF
jgi:hypothetical protein